jgi:hypothetical protein
MFAAMAELEASTITERVMSGKVQKAAGGGYNGARCPLGYTYQGGEFIVTDQAATVVGIFEQFVDGESMRAIAARLNDAGVATRAGGQWHTSTVRYILCNGFYAGLAQWGGNEAPGTHPAIISKDLYESAIRRLKALKPGPQERDAR